MDSIDELLADLSNVSAHMRQQDSRLHAGASGYGHNSSVQPQSSSYQQQSRQSYSSNRSSGGYNPPYRYGSTSSDHLSNNRSSSGSAGSGDYPAAPPLPPPPSSEVLAEASGYPPSEPLYEPQNIKYSGYNRMSGNNGVSPKSSTAAVGRSGAAVSSGQASLGVNLNELDALLDELNSSQYIKDMSRSNSETSVKSQPSPIMKMQPSVKPKAKQSSPKGNVSFNVNVNNSQVTPLHGSHGNIMRASSATTELDELMDSLSQFKINAGLQPHPASPRGQPSMTLHSPSSPRQHQQQSSPPQDDDSYAQVNKPSSKPTTPMTSNHSELDNMLGSLDANMRDQGVTVSTQGVCGACSKPVIGQVITALGKIWHVEHFCCYRCQEELGTRSFFERDEMPYCEPCYHKLFAPLCEKCNEPILDKIVTAMDSTWHMECFVCNHCGRLLNDEVFHEKDGRPYCRDDYFAKFAPKCAGCHHPIIEDFISTLNTQWHKHCFKCMECGSSLAGGSFYDHDGMPYCETHYYAKRGSLCSGCQKPITGRCITAMFRKFHPEHFVCAFCLKQLNKGTFKEQNDKPYCHPCFVKLFG